MIKKLLFLVLFFLNIISIHSQCSYPSVDKSVGTYTFCVDKNNSYTTGNVKAGEYALVDVVKGFRYTFSVGDIFPGNENLTLFNASNNSNLGLSGYASNVSGTTISNWVSPFSGQIKILLSRGDCNNDANTVSGALTLTLNSIGNTQDDQTKSGVDKWIGHVYNWTGSAPPGGVSPTTPSVSGPFITTNYVGYYNIPTESINENFGGDNNCFNVLSDEVLRSSIQTETFAVRYRMKSTKSGCYFLNVSGDDGVRVYIDNVLVLDKWKDQQSTSFCNNLIRLNGNSTIVLDYYENGGQNTVSLSLTALDGSSNVITSSKDIKICSEISPGKIDGTALTTCGGGSNTTYQWQVSDDDVSFKDINGANTEDYTPKPITTTGTVIKYYRRFLKAFASNAASCDFPTASVKITTSGGSKLVTPLINGSNTATQNTSGLIYSVAIIPNAITYNWTVPAGWIITSGANTNSITVTSGSLGENGNISVYASNGCAANNSITKSLAVTVISQNPLINLVKTDENCSIDNDGKINVSLSGGLTNVRYIKLTQKYASSDAYQQVAEIQAYEIFTNVNVALASNGADATASSVYQDNISGFGPMKTIDNNNSSIWHSKTASIDEWIKVDLKAVKNLNRIRIYNREDCCQARGQNMLLELFNGNNNLVYSKYVDLRGVSNANFIDVDILNVTWSDGATTMNRAGLDSDIYKLNYSDALGFSTSNSVEIVAAKPTPNAPVIKLTTHPDCLIKTGSVELTGLPTGSWTITTIPATANLLGTSGSTATTTVSGLNPNTNYTFTVSNGSCSSSPSVSVFIKALPLVATYNNGWTNGPPTIEQSIVFASNYSSSGNIVGCDCKVNPGKNVTINSGHTLTLTNGLNTVGALLTIEDTGSLVQINDAAINYGKIKYVRVTNTGVRNTDFTYWSSPVAQSKLGGTGGMEYQPANLEGTYFDSFYVDAVNQYWQSESMSNEMIPTRGYSIRGPGPINANPLSFLQVTFEGTPNNGAYSIPNVFEGKSYLVGNPYPSALDADQFLIDNRDVLDGTLYFWTHKTQVGIGVSKPGSGLYAYSGDDYATYNLTGGTATAKAAPSDPDKSLNNPFIPNGKIAAGQGFFANTKLSPESNIIKFTNSMRVGVKGNTGTNTQFFKTATTKSKKTTSIEKNRLWLNLYSDEGAFKQLLVGYITGATNEYDNGYDGETFDGNELADFYSINQETNFAIQGRALPFEASDVVPLGYRSKEKVTMSIDIDQVDGAIESQNIFIEDKMLNVVHDLKKGAYTFTSEAGVFNDRFVLRYTNKILGNVDFDLLNDQVIISKDKKELKIKSEIETIKRVTVFDLLGKKVLDKELLNETEFRSSTIGLSKQVGIVKVTLSSDKVITKKIAF
ncbi:T9SS sorting signal type C domain-containing protein [Flavobacterium sp. I-SCBP12n]|uniref:T9SS sorting signal type C domain-containing protein n=1 Tax=Flavobacterium pygoscelis TaxID=2893176 RepID=A0A9X1XNZ7_9FLAO|nr:T9SS sorting signal type C domain-containing protein [Flavobacterium pygoscelis]MCK8140343.1 T9SS sorting signal type C domain-containing protein [Flavobacterium pygoscelis]